MQLVGSCRVSSEIYLQNCDLQRIQRQLIIINRNRSESQNRQEPSNQRHVH